MLEMLPDSTVDHLTGHNTVAMRLLYCHPDRESLKRVAKKIKKDVDEARLYCDK
jgi:hypothetical protein